VLLRYCGIGIGDDTRYSNVLLSTISTMDLLCSMGFEIGMVHEFATSYGRNCGFSLHPHILVEKPTQIPG
jgi:hypothetical protein